MAFPGPLAGCTPVREDTAGMDSFPNVPSGIVGREAELAEIQEFLSSVPGGPVAVLLQGPAGIGKTTIWQSGVSGARVLGYQVLQARPAAAETELSFTALGDLLRPNLPELLPALPSPQARALEVALLEADPGADHPDPTAVSVAVSTSLRSLSTRAPVVLAIDDVQWLDPSSASVLRFALRRLIDVPFGVLATSRTGADGGDPLEVRSVLPDAAVRVVGVGPMPIEDLARLVGERIGKALGRPILVRLAEASRGNPFFAVEMARAILEAGEEVVPDQPLPVPRDLQEALGTRLSGLSDSALEVLVVASALARPTPTDVAAAVGERSRVMEALREAEEAGVINVSKARISFTHPLFASTIYSSAPWARRRLLHEHLSRIVEDPEDRANHVALATDGHDLTVARILEDAAQHAASRGAPAGAASFLERALTFVPPDHQDDGRRIVMDAARRHTESGNHLRAKALAEQAIASSTSGRSRAQALMLLASIVGGTEGAEGAADLYRQALAEAEGDETVEADVHQQLAWTMSWLGEVRAALDHATRAVELTERSDDLRVVASALVSRAQYEFHLGMDSARTWLERAEEIERQHPGVVPLEDSPRSVAAMHAAWSDDLAGARRLFQEVYRQAVALGDDTERAAVLYYLTAVECDAGNWDVARRHAEEGYDVLAQSGNEARRAALLYARGLVYGRLGWEREARACHEECTEIAERRAQRWILARNLSALGFLELSLGRPRRALEPLQRGASIFLRMGIEEPGSFHVLPDYVEALIAVHDLERAEDMTAWQQQRGEARGRVWALATAARCRALIEAARGALDPALREANRSLELLEKVSYPFERGRSLLVKGAIERRGKQRRAARDSLEAALAEFARLGAPLWADRAKAELQRISGRTRGFDDLTPTELQVARLVAQGLTNREVADRLFMTVRTVEANLSRIYRKQGVRSRTQLVQKLAG